MRYPDAPFLELGFYFRGKSGRQAIEHLVWTLLTSFNAIPRAATVSDSLSNSYFRSEKAIASQISITNNTALRQLFDDSHRFVRAVTIEHGTQIVLDAQEFAVVLPIESLECLNECNTVAVWIEGEAFSVAGNAHDRKKMRTLGSKAFLAFKEMVSLLRPTYAALTVDYSLETPCDLRRDGRTYAFGDCFLDRDVFGEPFLAEIRANFPNAFHDDWEHGQVTLTSGAFCGSLDAAERDKIGHAVSEFVGNRIAAVLT